MQNINPTSLPYFHGMITKDQETFLIEFEVLCRTYDYMNDAQKLRMFPSNSKEATLGWFMGLDGYVIWIWETMKNHFIEKYIEYCKSRDSRDEIFRMTQGEDESLEDYVERFHFIYRRSINCTIDENSLKTVLLRGAIDDFREALNLIASRDISKCTYDEIRNIYKNYSRDATKKGQRNKRKCCTKLQEYS